MEWREYQARYYEFRHNVHYARILGLVSRESTADFPDSVPNSIRLPLLEAYVAACNKVGAYLERLVPGEPPPVLDFDEITPADNPAKRIWIIAVELFLANAVTFGRQDGARLRIASHAQEHALLLAYLDSFITDSLRAACELVPRITLCMKAEERKDIDRFLHRRSYGTLVSRIQFVVEGTEPTSSFLEPNLNILTHAWEVRNLVMHHGGRVNSRFISKTGAPAEPGTVLSYNETESDELLRALRIIAHDIYLRVAHSAFQLSESDAIRV